MAHSGALNLLDDAASIAVPIGHDLVISKDMLVAGRHFFADDPPGLIAGKALRVNLSDLAAKGAEPLGFLLGLALPADWQIDWLDAFAKGLAADAVHFQIPLLGGDTVRADAGLTLSITALGSLPQGRMVRRGSTEAGDVLYVTGTIGDAALGLTLLAAEPPIWASSLDDAERSYLIARYHTPQPRNLLAATLLDHARAAMDISDGFIGDLTKFVSQAATSIVIEQATVPYSRAAMTALRSEPALVETVLTGGDDYEILAAIPAGKEASFIAAARRLAIPVTRLGTLQSAKLDVLRIMDGSGVPLRFASGSFAHF